MTLRLVGLAVVFLGGCFVLGDLTERSPAPVRRAAWVVDWSDAALERAHDSFERAGDGLTEIDLFRFRFDPEARIVASRPLERRHRSMLVAARRRGVEIVATVVNDTVDATGRTVALKDTERLRQRMTTPEAREAFATELAALAATHDLAGLDLDFEGLAFADREPMSALAEAVGKRLHADGRRLVVTVHPPTGNRRRDGPGGQDLERLAAAADEIRVMAYHAHWAGSDPGPSAPLPWVREILDRVLAEVPPAKVTLALYAGGWRWNAGEPGRQLRHGEAAALARELGRPIEVLGPEAVATFRSADGRTEVWFENAATLCAKIDLARDAGLGGVAFWHLGIEDPRLLDRLGAADCG